MTSVDIYCPRCGARITVLGRLEQVDVSTSNESPSRTWLRPKVEYPSEPHVCTPPDATADRGS